MRPKDLQTARDLIRSARNIVVFTGAGISAESGIPTFRDPGGIWDQFPPDRFATLTGLTTVYRENPDDLRRFFYTGMHTLLQARPNPGHFAIAELSRHVRVTVVTQNIDGLHQRAGSQTVHELHGSMFELHCTQCDRIRNTSLLQLAEMVRLLADPLPSATPHRHILRLLRPITPRCTACRGRMRPTVVLFEEMLPIRAWEPAEQAASTCDLMIVVGTSASVYPAAFLPELAHRAGAQIIVINKDPSMTTSWAHLTLTETAASALPELVAVA
jgi:NAD-dependent deacetylase